MIYRNCLTSLCLILAIVPFAFGQKQLKAEKVIKDYLQAAGGSKRLAAVKNAVYEWTFDADQVVAGRAKIQIQVPGSWRFDEQTGENVDLENGVAATLATNGSAVWRRDATGNLQTLTDAESKALQLQAKLAATRLTDLKKQRIAVQIITSANVDAEQKVIAVEFAARNGAKVLYYFDAKTKLPVKIENPVLKTATCFGDYRKENNVLEPHRIVQDCGTARELSLNLQKIVYDQNLNPANFDPPRTLENFDVAELVAQLQKNESELQSLLDQYSFTQTSIEREFSNNGSVKRETRRVYEVFPTQSGKTVLKLVSENNVPLAGEKLEKEEQRTAKELLEAAEDYEKERQKREKKRLEKQGGRDDSAPDESQLERNTIATLLRISEIYSPRIELFRNRETIVVNFRPRPGFKPSNLTENVFSKLAGTAWIDKEDKQIIRAEARVIDNISFGGFLAKFRKDSALVFERTKFDNRIWLPKLFQANASARFLFASFDAATDNEYGNYKKYESETKDYKISQPNAEKSEEKKP